MKKMVDINSGVHVDHLQFDDECFLTECVDWCTSRLAKKRTWEYARTHQESMHSRIHVGKQTNLN